MSVNLNYKDKIAVSYEEISEYDAAAQIAAELRIPLIPLSQRHCFPWLLLKTATRLELYYATSTLAGSLYVDFSQGSLGYRARHLKVSEELLLRAVGLKPGSDAYVVDATAGLGTDGFMLAHYGLRVVFVERSPILVLLLKDGLQRYPKISWECYEQDAKIFLQNLEEPRPDVVYIDPMYPTKKKTALPKKAMRIVRALVGDDEDADELLMEALKKAKQRVVVKRPRLAPYLGEKIPDIQYKGAAVRYDVYITLRGNDSNKL